MCTIEVYTTKQLNDLIEKWKIQLQELEIKCDYYRDYSNMVTSRQGPYYLESI